MAPARFNGNRSKEGNLYLRNPKAAVENGASPPFDLATWPHARVPFGEIARTKSQVTNAKSSQWMIAIGAVSVAAITVTVLNVDFSGAKSDKAAASSGSAAAATDVRPSIDFGPGPSEEVFYSEQADVERMGGSLSRPQATRLPSVVDSNQGLAAPAGEMPAPDRAREKAKDLSTPSPAEFQSNERNVASSSPEEPILTEPGPPTPKPKPASKAAERLAVQPDGLAEGETATSIRIAPTEQVQAGSLHTKGSGTELDARLAELEGGSETSNTYSVTTSDSSAPRKMVRDGLLTTVHVPGKVPVDEVPLDVELADASMAPTLPLTSARAVEGIEFILPALDAQAISHPAGVDDASSLEAPQMTSADEENARQLPRLASGVLDQTASSAGAVAPAAEKAGMVQDRSTVEIAANFPGWGAQGPSVELLPRNVTTQARAGGTAVGSLPLEISNNALVSVRLADLISLFEDRMDRPLFVWLKSSSSANEYVTFDTLKSAGIDAQYDAGTQQVALSIADERTP